MRLMSLISGGCPDFCVNQGGQSHFPALRPATPPARKKKPPERLCPRGAEDTIHFRERLDTGRAAGRRPAAGVLVYPKRAAYIHASGQSLRGPQEGRRRDLPRCRPIHVDYRVSSSGCFPAAFPGRRCSIHEGARIGHLSFGVKADFSCPAKKIGPPPPRDFPDLVNPRGQFHFRVDATRRCPKIGTVPRRGRAFLPKGVSRIV